MKRKFYTIIAMVALCCLLLIWMMWPANETAVESQNYSTGKPLVKLVSPTISAPEKRETTRSASVTPQTNTDATTSLRLRMRETVLRDFEWPIEFYGKVLDEKGLPIKDVIAHMIWTDTSPAGTSEATAKTDSSGAFSLEGKRGNTLQVWLNKAGYYTMETNSISFHFAEYAHRPDPNHPVLFRLRKKGEGAELITSQSGFSTKLEVSVPRDGVPVRVNLMERKVNGDGQLEISQVKPEYLQVKDAKAWTFQMALPTGGFVEQNDEFPFDAPETGYQSVLTFHFNRDDAHWSREIKKGYYIVFGRPPRYGWLTVQTAIGWGGVRLEYAINPTGSRNLEPAEPKPVRRELPPGVREVIPDAAR